MATEVVRSRYDIHKDASPIVANKREALLNSTARARERACQRFIFRATEVLSNECTEGPGQCYRHAAYIYGCGPAFELALRENFHSNMS